MTPAQQIQALRYLALAADDIELQRRDGKKPRTDLIGYARQYCGRKYTRKQFAEILQKTVREIVEL